MGQALNPPHIQSTLSIDGSQVRLLSLSLLSQLYASMQLLYCQTKAKATLETQSVLENVFCIREKQTNLTETK